MEPGQGIGQQPSTSVATYVSSIASPGAWSRAFVAEVASWVYPVLKGPASL